jgi:hypothetical protein
MFCFSGQLSNQNHSHILKTFFGARVGRTFQYHHQLEITGMTNLMTCHSKMKNSAYNQASPSIYTQKPKYHLSEYLKIINQTNRLRNKLGYTFLIWQSLGKANLNFQIVRILFTWRDSQGPSLGIWSRVGRCSIWINLSQYVCFTLQTPVYRGRPKRISKICGSENVFSS